MADDTQRRREAVRRIQKARPEDARELEAFARVFGARATTEELERFAKSLRGRQ